MGCNLHVAWPELSLLLAVGDPGCHLYLGGPNGALGDRAVGDMGGLLHWEEKDEQHEGQQEEHQEGKRQDERKEKEGEGAGGGENPTTPS